MSNGNMTMVTVQQEAITAAALYGAKTDIEDLYRAVSKVAPWTSGRHYTMTGEEILLTCRRSLAMGLDPLNSHEVQIWKDHHGVHFQLAYTLVTEWVRHFKGDFTSPRYQRLSEPEMAQEGLEPEDVAYRAIILMKKDIPVLQQLIQAGYKTDQARRMLEITGIGVATADEWASEHFAPKGRTKAWKVKKRALTDALRGHFGTPTRAEIVELRRIRGDSNLTLDDWMAAEGLNSPQDQLEAARAAAEYRLDSEEWEELTPEERQARVDKARRLLSGLSEDEDLPPIVVDHRERNQKEDAGDVIDVEAKTKEPPSEEPDGARPGAMPRSVADTLADLRSEAGWSQDEDGGWKRAPDDEVQPPNKKAVQRAAALLTGMVGDDDERHKLQQAVLRRESLNKATKREVEALLRWAELDDERPWEFGPIAQIEAQEIVAAYEKQKAQAEAEAAEDGEDGEGDDD